MKPVKTYPTVEGLKVKPIITIEGTGRGVWIKTRSDTIDIGDFDKSEIVIDTEQFNITKNGGPIIRPMNDFYIYPNEPLYIQTKDSTFNLIIRYPNRLLQEALLKHVDGNGFKKGVYGGLGQCLSSQL